MAFIMTAISTVPNRESSFGMSFFAGAVNLGNVEDIAAERRLTDEELDAVLSQCKHQFIAGSSDEEGARDNRRPQKPFVPPFTGAYREASGYVFLKPASPEGSAGHEFARHRCEYRVSATAFVENYISFLKRAYHLNCPHPTVFGDEADPGTAGNRAAGEYPREREEHHRPREAHPYRRGRDPSRPPQRRHHSAAAALRRDTTADQEPDYSNEGDWEWVTTAYWGPHGWEEHSRWNWTWSDRAWNDWQRRESV